MRAIIVLPVLLLISGLWCAPAEAQTAQGAEGPAAAGLNRTFSFGDRWAMYGAPQAGRLSHDDFQALVRQVRDTRFEALVTQVVVIVRGGDVDATLGLIEKRRYKTTSLIVGESGVTTYDVWHAVGYPTDPERILLDCLDNILAAEERYRDLPVTFTGQVKRVARDAQGELFVEFLIGSRHPESTLACYPWSGAGQRVDLRALKSGDKLKASGQFAAFEDGNLKMKGCLFSR